MVHRLAFTLPRTSERHSLVLRVDPATKACTLQADDLPTQAVPGRIQAEWMDLIAALGRDYLLDLDGRSARAQVKAIAFQRGGHDWFTLERRDLAYRVGESSWQLSWAEGREKASELAVARALSVLCDMSVIHSPRPVRIHHRRRRCSWSPGAASTLQDNRMLVIAVDGDRAWTAYNHGVMGVSSPILRIEPSQLLDLAVLDAAP